MDVKSSCTDFCLDSDISTSDGAYSTCPILVLAWLELSRATALVVRGFGVEAAACLTNLV